MILNDLSHWQTQFFSGKIENIVTHLTNSTSEKKRRGKKQINLSVCCFSTDSVLVENGHFSWVRSYRYCYASCERLRCFSETAIKDMVECLQYASMGIGQFDIMYKERYTSCTIDFAFLQVQPMFISSVSLEVCKKIYSRVHIFMRTHPIQSNHVHMC